MKVKGACALANCRFVVTQAEHCSEYCMPQCPAISNDQGQEPASCFKSASISDGVVRVAVILVVGLFGEIKPTTQTTATRTTPNVPERNLHSQECGNGIVAHTYGYGYEQPSLKSTQKRCILRSLIHERKKNVSTYCNLRAHHFRLHNLGPHHRTNFVECTDHCDS